MIACIADVHLWNHRAHGGAVEAGVNQRAQDILKVFRAATEQAFSAGADALVVCGDVFDGLRPEPQLIAELQRAVRAARLPIYFLVGNHDLASTAPGDHALGPLEVDTGFSLGTPTAHTWGLMQVLFVPYSPGRAEEWLAAGVAGISLQDHTDGACRVLVTHVGLIDSETPPWLREAHDAVRVDWLAELCERNRIDVAVCGNWHSYREWSTGRTTLVQVGALAPTGWDNQGLAGEYGSLITVGPSRCGRVELSGPRFIQGTVEEIGRMAPAFGVNKVYARVVGEFDPTDPRLRACHAVEGVLDRKTLDRATRDAATMARASDTLDEALVAYVGEMSLDDGVDRNEVIARAQQYLARR